MGALDSLLAPRQKAETGRGAAMIRDGVPLFSTRDTPEQKAKTAFAAYHKNTYIRGAERAITSRISMVPWWLEDGDGDRVTDESDQELQGVLRLLERPYQPLPNDPVVATPQTFDGLRDITIRHVGLVGYAFWFVVKMGDLPLEFLYLNPARVTPALDKAGQLLGWVLDADATGKGTPLSLEEVIPFYLEPPDSGFLPEGLVTTVLAKTEITRLADHHVSQLLASGGRIPGIFHPPSGDFIEEEAYQGLVRDLRTIMEDPNAAKRTLVLKGPLEFEQTALGLNDLRVLELMNVSRDDTLGVWGVPASQMGYQRPVGLGDTAEDKDAEVMWKNSAGPRFHGFADVLQRRVLDLLPMPIRFMWEEPEFDDKGPQFEMAQKSLAVPMRNVERRDLLGLPPFGDDELDNQIVLPINIVAAGAAPEFDPGDRAKARLAQNPQVVRLKEALTAFLTEQAQRIGKKIEDRAGHIERKPGDETAWWNEKEEDAALFDAIRPHLLPFAEQGADRALGRIRGKAAESSIFTESLLAATLRRLGFRVTGINRTTRDRIRELITAGLEAELSPSEIGRSLRGLVDPLPDDTVGNKLRERLGSFGSELRAETIARTEMRVAQNGAALDSYSVEGVQLVEMLDGDEDAECAARDGKVVTMEEAESHMAAEHPNGTLDFAPVTQQQEIGKAFGPGGPYTVEAGERIIPQSPVTVNYPPPVIEMHYTPPPVEIPATEVHVPKPDPVNVEVTTPAPVVNVAPAAVSVEAPTVNVAAPDVQVSAPEVTVEAPQAKASGEPQAVFVTNMPSGKTKVIRDPKTQRIVGAERE